VLIRTLLVALGLLPFVETIGGKGLHVAVPLKKTARLEHGEKNSTHLGAALCPNHPAKVGYQKWAEKTG